MRPPDALVHLVSPWAAQYSDSPVLATAVTFLHLAGVLAGGGTALVADRTAVRAVRADATVRARLLDELALAHLPVLLGLGVTAVTGVLLLAADLETYLGSALFLAKMGLVVLLIANGAVLTRAERSLRAAGGAAVSRHAAWRILRRTAYASRALWLLTLLAGVAVLNAA